MLKEWIILAQKILKVKTDGNPGPKTLDAANKYISAKKVEHLRDLLPDLLDPQFTIGPKLIAVIQMHATLKKIQVGAVDSFMGPQTEFAIDILLGQHQAFTRSDFGEGFPASSDIEKYYGKVGANQVMAQIPFELMIAWDLRKKITSFSCHEKVVRSVEQCYARVLSHYGEDRIAELYLNRFGGCLNVRKMRGGTSWSTHAWGIAIDTDPVRNKLRWNHTRASLAMAEYDEWFNIWEDAGWLSLGRARDFDWMHLQATSALN